VIPLVGGVLGFMATTFNAVGIGGTAGASYALGRKYGRKMCEWSDTMEDRIRFALQSPRDME
tara:strand:- start:59 stop:244 length:186 start_codon:yes stop_codon:yes gene_type:complete